MGTKIEPTLCRADRLVGHVLGTVGTLPDIFIELEISYYLLKRLLGVRMEGEKKGAKVSFSVIYTVLLFFFVFVLLLMCAKVPVFIRISVLLEGFGV